MKVKYVFINGLMLVTGLSLAIILNISFTNVLNNETKMSEVAKSENELLYNTSAVPTYNTTKNEKKVIMEYEKGQSKGIDVSKYQGKINWAKVKKSGVEFAIIRVGFRGYKGGDIHLDTNFYDNMNGALKNGIKVGVYFFSAARNEREAIKEAKWVVDKISPYKNQISYPVVFDLENINSDRLEGVSGKQLTKNAMAFLDYIANSGYTPMFYGGRLHMTKEWDMSKLNKYKVWLAHYTEKTDYKDKYDMWQYDSQAKVPGIKGNVDVNIAYFKVIIRESDTANEEVINNTPFDKVNDQVVIATYANFRKSPTFDLDNKISDSLSPGTKVQRIGVSKDGQWSRIIYKDTIGYIFNNYLKRI